MCRLLGTDIENARSRELASVPLSLRGLGLRSATRTREAACWASWADCLFMVRNRHPVVVDRIRMDELECTRSAAVAAHHLAGVEGFEVHSWEALSHGLRPDHMTRKIVNLEDFITVGNTKRPPELSAISGVGT